MAETGKQAWYDKRAPEMAEAWSRSTTLSLDLENSIARRRN